MRLLQAITQSTRALLRPTASSRPTNRLLSSTGPRHASSSITMSPKKDAQQDREKMNTEPTEYSKSGTDSSSAGQEDAAFGGNTSDPQDAKKKAGEGTEENPLDASPASPELSQGTSEEASGAGVKEGERDGPSGPGKEKKEGNPGR